MKLTKNQPGIFHKRSIFFHIPCILCLSFFLWAIISLNREKREVWFFVSAGMSSSEKNQVLQKTWSGLRGKLCFRNKHASWIQLFISIHHLLVPKFAIEVLTLGLEIPKANLPYQELWICKGKAENLSGTKQLLIWWREWPELEHKWCRHVNSKNDYLAILGFFNPNCGILIVSKEQYR